MVRDGEIGSDADLTFDARTLEAPDKPLLRLREHGAILVRNAIDPAVAALPVAGIDAWYDGHVGKIGDGELISGGHLREPVDAILTAVAGSVFTPIACAFLGAEFIGIPINHMLYRRRNDSLDAYWERGGSRHQFHQDQGLIPDSFPMNAWIAASAVDAQSVGLSIVFPTPTEPMPQRFDAFDVDAYLAEHNGGVLVTPYAPR